MNLETLNKGDILISEPFLGDANFERSVILLCDHSEEGSFGFVLNHPTELQLDELGEGMPGLERPLYLGGPVERNTLHILHRAGGIIPGGVEVHDGIWWGGDFEEVKSLLTTGVIKESDVIFFLGYTGWGKGQLESEIVQKSWIKTLSTEAIVFDRDPKKMWRTVLKEMGGKYRQLSNYPIDPRLN